MTEAEWLACEDPSSLLRQFADLASIRKLRLFACACCRRVWHHLEDAQTRAAIEAAERYADGLISKDALSAAQSEASRAMELASRTNYKRAVAARAAKDAARPTDFADKLLKSVAGVSHYSALAESRSMFDNITRSARCGLLRDILGNPFHLHTFASEWRTDTTVALTSGMYESRDFSAMPILADALQDAGCDRADILDHCRDPNGTHVRGCWVVDLVLGKK